MFENDTQNVTVPPDACNDGEDSLLSITDGVLTHTHVVALYDIDFPNPPNWYVALAEFVMHAPSTIVPRALPAASSTAAMRVTTKPLIAPSPRTPRTRSSSARCTPPPTSSSAAPPSPPPAPPAS